MLTEGAPSVDTRLEDAERKQAVKAFIAEYGGCGEALDEDKWLVWLGVWISAWHACCLPGKLDKG